MEKRPGATLSLLALALGLSASPAFAAEAPPPPSAVQPEPPGEPCTGSRECAARLGYGNVCDAGQCRPYLDRTDIFNALHLTEKAQPKPAPFELYPAIIPAVGYNPALGFLIGAVGTFGMYLGAPEDTTMSSASALALITTEKQIVLQLNSTLMTSANDWELQGDWRFLLYNQDTYGLGTDVPPIRYGFSIGGWGETAPVPGAQLVKFDLVRIHQAALKRLIPNLYAGAGFRYDRYFAIEDESLNLTATPPVVTSHYAYSLLYGFDPAAYTVSGLTADVLYDSRDSTISAYRGFYAHLAFRVFPTWLGSSQASTMAAAEFRAYLGLSDAVPRNVLALWLMASGVTSGYQPYLALPSIGWDAKGTTGRGYVQGRLRGASEAYLEAEWRFRITDNGLLGGALFANATTMSRPAVSLPAYGYFQPATELFQSVKPAGGVGLRFMMNREARTSVRLDLAWGVDSFGVYFGAGEAF